MRSPFENRLALRICAWCGPAAILLLVIGLVILGGFIPPPAATDSASEVQAAYLKDEDAIRAGLLIAIFGMCLLAPWGVSIAAVTRRSEGRTPIWTYLQVASVAIGTTIAVLCAMVWALAAFRPGEAGADVTQMLNNFGWFLFLFSAPAFSVWDLAIAGAILTDKSERPLIPRWVAYTNIWCAVGEIPAIFLLVSKTGPLAFNGALCFWIPTVVFFLWMPIMTYVVLKAIKENSEPVVESAAVVEETPEPVAVGA